MSDTFYTSCVTVGNRLLYRGYRDGYRVREEIPYSPILFVPTNKETKYKTVEGKSVDRVAFPNISDAKKFIEEYKEVSNFNIYGNTNFHYCYISDTFKEQVEYNNDLIRTITLDIETKYDSGFPKAENPIEEVIAITIKYRNQFYVFGTKEFQTSDKSILYFKCNDEEELLLKFLEQWEEIDADVVTGWNIQWFDIPYLIARINNVLGDKKANRLSPWKILNTRMVTLNGQTTEVFELIGLPILDYMEMYKKYMPTQPSYKLNNIAEAELGEGKISYEGSLIDLYNQDFNKFIEYNIKDVDLVSKLDAKTKFINMVCAIAYDAKVNYTDVFTQVRMWDTIIFNYFRQHNIVMPQKKRNEKSQAYAGAYVKDPQVGLHDWVVSFDLDSLYPHLIAQFNISPEMIVAEEFKHDISVDKLLEKTYNLDDLKDKELTVAANGHCFKINKQGFLPEILMRMYADRKIYKNKMLEAESELERIEEEIKSRGLNG